MGQLAGIPDPWGAPSWDEPPSNSDDTAMLLTRALNQIRPMVEPLTWDAFWNTAVLGRSASEVAAELGMTSMAVRQAKSRILRRLRKQLGDDVIVSSFPNGIKGYRGRENAASF